MNDVNSAIYDVIASKKTVYIYFLKICSDFKKLKKAESFSIGQIEKLVSLYLAKLTKKGLLVKTTYPSGIRYKKTELFHKNPYLMKVEVSLKHEFLSSLDMQRALCNFELMDCKSKLTPYIMDTMCGLTLEKEDQLDYLIKKEKIYFLQNKLSAINNLLDIYKLERISIN